MPQFTKSSLIINNLLSRISYIYMGLRMQGEHFIQKMDPKVFQYWRTPRGVLASSVCAHKNPKPQPPLDLQQHRQCRRHRHHR
jgi:hypothetical protein